VIPAAVDVGKSYTVIDTATSLDQSFSKDGNNANKINAVRIISAKLEAVNPADFNLRSAGMGRNIYVKNGWEG
jgi:hypothetical protein